MALAWVLPDERNAIADAVLDSVIQNGAYVPFIFPAEFSNGLTMAVRRGRIDRSERATALDRISNVLKIIPDLEGLGQMEAAVELADRHSLTVYDALYLELAHRLRLPLATFDKKLIAAARRAAVRLAAPPT